MQKSVDFEAFRHKQPGIHLELLFIDFLWENHLCLRLLWHIGNLAVKFDDEILRCIVLCFWNNGPSISSWFLVKPL